MVMVTMLVISSAIWMWKVSVLLLEMLLVVFLGEDVGNIIGEAFNSFVAGLRDFFVTSGDGSGWLGGMSNGGGYRKRKRKR